MQLVERGAHIRQIPQRLMTFRAGGESAELPPPRALSIPADPESISRHRRSIRAPCCSSRDETTKRKLSLYRAVKNFAEKSATTRELSDYVCANSTASFYIARDVTRDF